MKHQLQLKKKHYCEFSTNHNLNIHTVPSIGLMTWLELAIAIVRWQLIVLENTLIV
jgi:hypothetical protein